MFTNFFCVLSFQYSLFKKFKECQKSCLKNTRFYPESTPEDALCLTDCFGRSVLHYAALSNRFELIPLLVAYGAEIDVRDGKVFFHFALFHEGILSILILCSKSLITTWFEVFKKLGFSLMFPGKVV